MEIKKCPRCKLIKSIYDFYKGQGYCISCNKEKYSLWRLAHLEKRKLDWQKYVKIKPWVKTYNNIKSRLYHKNLKRNLCYKRNNVKNYLTTQDLKHLWFRDKAYKMKRPSIHRFNNKKSYTIKNCIYIEFNQHCKIK